MSILSIWRGILGWARALGSSSKLDYRVAFQVLCRHMAMAFAAASSFYVIERIVRRMVPEGPIRAALDRIEGVVIVCIFVVLGFNIIARFVLLELGDLVLFVKQLWWRLRGSARNNDTSEGSDEHESDAGTSGPSPGHAA